MIDITPGQCFSSEVTLNPTLVSEFAKAAGDHNPLCIMILSLQQRHDLIDL
ncbi:MAG: hypothetical protein IID03_00710 [Candidatus Dadabacteria bacterium]|nr:hypothetical protein [Candidatus Dadabacteria bacterium]